MDEMRPSMEKTEEQVQEAAASLADELRDLGKLLAAAMRAAANTPEAERLRAEVKDGARALRSEIDSTVEATRERTTRASQEYRSSGLQKLRSDLAAALRAVNRTLDGLAMNIEPTAPGDSGSDSDTGAGGVMAGG